MPTSELVELPVERAENRKPLAEQIPVECLEVAQVENDTVPFWNGAVVEGVGMYDIEQCVRLSTSVREADEQPILNPDINLRSRHLPVS